MSTQQVHIAFEDISHATVMPKLVHLDDDIYAVKFTLMKQLPARHIIDNALADGRIGPDTVVVETTSGTFGLGLAIECKLHGIPLHLVSDPVIEGPTAERIRDLGATVDIVREPAEIGGFQASRLARLDEVMRNYPSTFCPRQYDNPENPEAYTPVAEQVLEALGQVDHIVGPVGSGGSMSGLTRALRRAYPKTTATAVDTEGSVLFAAKGGPRKLRGLGNGLIPGNLDHTMFDSVHWVSETEALSATRALHRNHALYVGLTSGAAHKVALWEAKQRSESSGSKGNRAKRGKTLVIMPDEAHRYKDQLWGQATAEPARIEPVRVNHPGEIDDQWCTFEWNRRTLAEVSNV